MNINELVRAQVSVADLKELTLRMKTDAMEAKETEKKKKK